MTIPAYPLQWPSGFPRTREPERSQFKTQLSSAVKNVQTSLRLFGQDAGISVDEIVVSSNASVADHTPADTGVAVWFTWDGNQHCIPVDRYAKIEDNLQAIHHIVEARRVELRHGSLALVKASFTGFLRLEGPGKSWRDVLDVPGNEYDLETVRKQYKKLASLRHPDKPGGSTAAMTELNAAMTQATEELL